MQVPGIGEGIAKIGDSLSKLGMQLFEADAAPEATVAVGQAYQGFSSFRASLAQDFDYTSWESRFTAKADDNFARISESIKNPLARKRE